MGLAADGEPANPDIEITDTGINADGELCTRCSGDMVPSEEPEE